MKKYIIYDERYFNDPDRAIAVEVCNTREEAESRIIREKVWNWYTSTAYTRLEKDASVILIMTRWHKDDLAGRRRFFKTKAII